MWSQLVFLFLKKRILILWTFDWFLACLCLPTHHLAINYVDKGKAPLKVIAKLFSVIRVHFFSVKVTVWTELKLLYLWIDRKVIPAYRNYRKQWPQFFASYLEQKAKTPMHQAHLYVYAFQMKLMSKKREQAEGRRSQLMSQHLC